MKHRTALVMAGSIVGVMLAGTAVLAANFGILSGADDLGVLDPQTPPVSTVLVAPRTAPTTTPSELVAYQVEGLGVVTLVRQGDILTVDSVAVDPAWTWEVDDDSDHLGGVKIEFSSGDREIEFRAWIENGEVVVNVEEENVVVDGTVSDDDDSDDDEHESASEHEDDEHEDDGSHEEDD